MVDTSVVVAFMNRGDDDHERVVAWMEAAEDGLFTTYGRTRGLPNANSPSAVLSLSP